tara:strand:- start:34 stop:366 length:333 start_codon:yes stop_codon:yes gene_type:complete
MIDTDKYEGHTPAPWEIHGERIHAQDACKIGNVGGKIATVIEEINTHLIADSPLLLEEVKRLREELDGREAYIKRLSEQLSRATKWAYKQVLHNDSAMMNFDDYVWGEEE